ncbi:M16 family metallopeptidase [Kitasatospora sp. NPDC006697]|uniref:M16 family metallopeptidase n=1 Tax=Kitasatospora sp. NPDC006697 TaxID=3364020 RepID=UPI00367CA839
MSRLPALGAPRPVRIPEHVEVVLPSGLTVLAVRRQGEPLAETRLRIPFAGADGARAALLARTLLARTVPAGATAAQRFGGTLGAEVDRDRLRISGRAPAGALDRLLAVLVDALEAGSYPAAEVRSARAGLAEQLRTDRSRPAQQAAAALARRIHHGHPYGRPTPEPAAVGAVTEGELAALHRELVRPVGSTLVIVGALDPQAAAETAARRLAHWTGTAPACVLPPVPPLRPGPLLLLDRPGSTQSALRIAFPAVSRGHRENAPLRLANLVFGGYFCSRWVANLREDKGYTYGPHSAIEERPAGARLIAAVEVATEYTAPTLVETLHELGRLACLPPTRAEVDRARQYTLGALAVLGMSTHRDLANLVAGLVDGGLPLGYLAEHVDRLAGATVDEVHEAARAHLAPSGAVAVLVADAARVERAVAAVMPVTVCQEVA